MKSSNSDIKWERFFENNIEGYLLSDLREMNKIKVDGPGNCGYPMLMSMLSGMELLGGLISFDKKWSSNGNDGRRYFEQFYVCYIIPLDASYELDGIEKEMYGLVRNKLAHTFLTAINFEIAKNNESSPVTRNGAFFRIDVGLLFTDFEAAIYRLKSELTEDSDLALRFQAHLNQIVRRYGGEILTKYTDQQDSTTEITTTISGMKLPYQHFSAGVLATTAFPVDNFKSMPLITTGRSKLNVEYGGNAMKRAVILHGTDGNPEKHWFPWLKKKLEEQGYEVWVPLLPENHTPDRQTYNDFLLNSGWDFTDNIVVGHSSGAVSVLNMLMDERASHIKLGVMAGAWATMDVGESQLNAEQITAAHLEKEQFKNLFSPEGFDFGLIESKADKLAFIHGDDDPLCPLDQAQWLAKQLDAPMTLVPHGGHLLDTEYAGLWQIIEPAL